MLLALCVTAALGALAVWCVARVLLVTLDRLRLDPVAVLLWLGLAEHPIERRPARRQRPRG